MKKFLIKLCSLFIFNSVKRKAYRKSAWANHIQNNCNSLRWGASYSVFDGEELLEASLKSIRSEVDYINVVYQLTSWYGNPANPGLKNTLDELRAKGLIDELIEFVPDLSLKAGDNERNKRNIGLRQAKAQGCDYFMTIDCDEMYLAEEMRSAKAFICENNITHSYCRLLSYGPEPTMLRTGSMHATSCFVPFFQKLYSDSQLVCNHSLPCSVDPTRQMSSHDSSDKHYILSIIIMHHMTLVRRNLHLKYANSSWNNGETPVSANQVLGESYLGGSYLVVEDAFSIQQLLNSAHAVADNLSE